jgi:HK97 family phage prohead protease
MNDTDIIDQDPEYDLVPSYARALCSTSIKAVNKETREVAHLITTTNPDRVGDVVEASGADLANYLRHPVVMADHSYSIDRIIGRAVNLTVDEKGIFARTKYRDTPLGRDAFNLAAEGLGAWSIGFRPISFKAMKDDKGYTKGFHFTKWEMLEYSQVAIPMNADAVQNAVTRGLVAAENVKTFFRVDESVTPALERPSGDQVQPTADAKQLNPAITSKIRRAISRAETVFAIHEGMKELEQVLRG